MQYLASAHLLQLLLAVVVLLAAASCAVAPKSSNGFSVQEPGQAITQTPNSQAQVTRQAIGLECAQRFAQVQALIEARQMEQAESLLLDAQTHHCSTDYEAAQLWRLLGYVHSAQRDYPQAAQAYEQAVQSKHLDIVARSQSLYTLSQIRFIERNYQAVIADIDAGRAAGLLIDIKLESLLVKSLYRVNRIDDALVVLERLFNDSQLSGKQFKEASLAQLWTLYYQREDYDQALAVSRLLVNAYPKNKYWQQVTLLCNQPRAPKHCNSSDPEWRLFMSKMP